jgi:redox-sensitive bicupin YhaK (pirin superfamily)
MVGPFIFFDAFGPAVFRAGDGVDTRPHPHIGLATLTYLIKGDIMHRDSAGNAHAISPGEVNLMTAGRGIVHSERSTEFARAQESALFGQQVWLALPKDQEEVEPSFNYHAANSLPHLYGDGAMATLLAGSAFGFRSPVTTYSDMIYADIALEPKAKFKIPTEHTERAIYVVEGVVQVVGQVGLFAKGELIVFKPSSEIILQASTVGVRLMLIGGEPLPEKRFIGWNFVSSSVERIEQAMFDWKEHRFPNVPDETEFIPGPAEIIIK